MADICIIFAREAEETASKLYDDLSQNWDVWWDYSLVGKHPVEIPKELETAKCIIPIWSKSANDCDYLYSELETAKDKGKVIIPVKIEDCTPPMGYHPYSHVELREWLGEADHDGIKQLRTKISTVIKPKCPPSRPIPHPEILLKFPLLFHSTSSFETKLKPHDALNILALFGEGEAGDKSTQCLATALVSAYDLVDENYETKDDLKKLQELKDNIHKFRKKGGFILIDSGNYEAARLDDNTWSREKFGKALEDVPHDWVLSFDYGKSDKDGDRNPVTISEDILRGLDLDRKHSDKPIIPILHAPEVKDVGHDLADLPQLAKVIAESANPPMIAIPERELGPGLLESAQTVIRIREALNELPNYQPLHILGTGNPWSIAVYTAAGADSFDGLEWCRYCIDAKNHTLHHYQHFDFFSYQAKYADYSIVRDAQLDTNVLLSGKIGLHNLDYYANFCHKLRDATYCDRAEGFITKVLSGDRVELLEELLKGIFKK